MKNKSQSNKWKFIETNNLQKFKNWKKINKYQMIKQLNVKKSGQHGQENIKDKEILLNNS